MLEEDYILILKKILKSNKFNILIISYPPIKGCFSS